MDTLDWAALLFCGAATFVHLLSSALAYFRIQPSHTAQPPSLLPPVTLLRPVCGLDNYEELTLRSGFGLDYPDYELIFCCARQDDPVVPLIHKLIDQHPHVRARLLIGDHQGTSNPKLGNLVKGWCAASHQWIVMADSNVLMPPDYIQCLLEGWRADTGLISAPPIGCMPAGFWAQLECAFLNGYQARWQYAADSVGMGFAQGKTMLWRRVDLERAGGILALANEIAEDAAATKVVREMGLRVHLAQNSFGQPLGRRSPRQVWARQLRWARLRRATFAVFFVPELFAGCLFPFLAGVYAATAFGIDPLGVLLVLGLLWFGSEAALTKAAGWPLSLMSPIAWLLRDMLLPVLWVCAWLNNRFTWRGNEMRIADAPLQRDMPR